MKQKIIVLFTLLLFATGCSANDSKKETMFSIVKEKIGKEAMVLEIGSSSCAGCIKMKKIIDSLKSHNPNLPIHIVDVYDDMNAFKYFKIQMIPTQVVFNKAGEEVFRHIGGLSEDEVLKLVELSKK